MIASSGVKSLLDVPATVELLETLSVPVLGYRTDTLPLFYAAQGGPPVSARVETAQEIARIADAHWRLGGNSILVGRPPDESLDVAQLTEAAVAEAERQGISGQRVTPFVLAFLHEQSGGETHARQPRPDRRQRRARGRDRGRACALRSISRERSYAEPPPSSGA